MSKLKNLCSRIDFFFFFFNPSSCFSITFTLPKTSRSLFSTESEVPFSDSAVTLPLTGHQTCRLTIATFRPQGAIFEPSENFNPSILFWMGGSVLTPAFYFVLFFCSPVSQHGEGCMYSWGVTPNTGFLNLHTGSPRPYCSQSKTNKYPFMELWIFLCRLSAGNNSQVFHARLDLPVITFFANSPLLLLVRLFAHPQYHSP